MDACRIMDQRRNVRWQCTACYQQHVIMLANIVEVKWLKAICINCQDIHRLHSGAVFIYFIYLKIQEICNKNSYKLQ